MMERERTAMQLDMRALGDEYMSLLRPLGTGEANLPALTGPDMFFPSLLDYALERSYLNELSSIPQFPHRTPSSRTLTWVCIERLPVHPTRSEEYELLSRWQGVLSSLHSWEHRLVFLLLRHAGQTRLFLG